ncbi:MAG: diguanylate cyclase [Clostridiales Family XIII bacterium]|jgi:diguanylate cyclase (GGDEF)-like protein|nr:diguanylate cyclase [Clostridiales Family XIII bacterium]
MELTGTLGYVVVTASLALAVISLVLNIALFVRSRRLRERYEKNIDKLKGQVYKDELTDLFNRRYFIEQVPGQLDRARRSGTPVSLIILDIDHFKRVNDTFGHPAGDEILKNFANKLKKAVRVYDIVVRFGGEEFAVFMPDVDGYIAKISAERIRRCVEGMMTIYEGNQIRITCSLGIASVASGSATVDELIEIADHAMYEAKTTGRNRVFLAPPIVRGEDTQVAEFKEKHEEQNRTTIRLDLLSRVFSRALDVAERTIFGVSEHHSARVAAVCAAMGKKLGYDDDSLAALTICALFHDNALTEYMWEERRGATLDSAGMRLHCEYGQRNVEWLPFKKSVEGLVLYHHERADGSGAFGKKKGEYPRGAGLIAIADALDVSRHLEGLAADDIPDLMKRIDDFADEGFDGEDILLLKSIIDEDMLAALKNENISVTLDSTVPVWLESLKEPSVLHISGMIAHIIDYISEYTLAHTIRVANIAWIMGEHYGFDEVTLRKLYLAAALHDIGMITVPPSIIEKPGAVTESEYHIIKQHTTKAREWLSDIPNFKNIGDWALNHHERIDGSGYGLGLTEAGLDKCSRLLACIDVFEGINSKRPYHEARTFDETFFIMDAMAAAHRIDAEITADIRKVITPYEGREIPAPY